MHTNNIVVYPTPAKGFVYIHTADAKDLQVFDLTGRRMVHNVFNNQSLLKIDIHHLNKGVYILQVIATNGTVQTQKMVVE